MRAETRHQLKQDTFSRVTIGAAEKTAHWSVEHRNTLAMAAVAVVVIVALVAGGWFYLSKQDEKASFDLSIAVRTLDTPLRAAESTPQPDSPSFASVKERAEAAQKQFQAIVDKYPHTRTADMARYFLGVTAEDSGDHAAAEKDFKAVASTGNKELASVSKVTAQLQLAELYQANNQPIDAKHLYEQVKKDNPSGGDAAQIATQKLAELK